MHSIIHQGANSPLPVCNIPELVRRHAKHQAERLLFRFLPRREDDPIIEWTYGEVSKSMAHVAKAISRETRPGERALLLVGDQQDFVQAFFGCLYAGVIAVPVYPPSGARRGSALARLKAIIHDCEAHTVVSTSKILAAVADEPIFDSLTKICLDRLDTDSSFPSWQPPEVNQEMEAFLQYTSGSTGNPKGVVLTHGNMLANLQLFEERLELHAESHLVNWMPLFHDLGLSLMLTAPWTGIGITLMTPDSFLRRPGRWLETISTFKADVSGGPNFCYELCIGRVSKEEEARLDLSSWRIAFNAAEPVRPDTIDRFAARFTAAGLRPHTSMAAYGLAEATAFVTAGLRTETPRCRVVASALEEGRVVEAAGEDADRRTLISNGWTGRDGEVCIVDPETHRVCPPDIIGEIWVSGPQIAHGYWNDPAATDESFGATLPHSDRAFLRTGDLGFMRGQELFVTGRIKDVIIIRGRNHYPQDIELTVERCRREIRFGCVAAFPLESDGEETLGIVAEIKEEVDEATVASIAQEVREAVAERHGLHLHALALISPRTIHKTSSGKIQRRFCKKSFLSHEFKEIHRASWPLPNLPSPPNKTLHAVDVDVDSTRGAWPRLIHTLSHLLGWEPHAFRREMSLSSIGLDSKATIELVGKLEDTFHANIDIATVYEHPSLGAFADYLDAIETPAPQGAPTRAASSSEDVAIIGISCRLPGDVHNLDSLWKLFSQEKDAVSSLPRERVALDHIHTSWKGGFLQDIDTFDAPFFAIARREAEAMDPQQRLLLEVVWHALEHAGRSIERLVGSRTSLFAGLSPNDYSMRARDEASQRLSPYAGDRAVGERRGGEDCLCVGP